MSNFHTSVLLYELVEFLDIKAGKTYIDATLGGGGHALEIARREGHVLGIDVDEEAIQYTREALKTAETGEIAKNITLVQGNFKEIDSIAKHSGFSKVDGVLFDLGVSSHQLEVGKRGFSFLRGGPLDMRMDQTLQVTASDLVNGLTKNELIELFEKLGEEPRAKIIAGAIVRSRAEKAIVTTGDLAAIIEGSVGRDGKIHPGTKVFQALRIAVNDELHALEEALGKAPDLLVSEGRLAVISFHSLEDRIVKRTLLTLEEKGLGKVLTKKPVVPSTEELAKNARARSAKLRVFEKQ